MAVAEAEPGALRRVDDELSDVRTAMDGTHADQLPSSLSHSVENAVLREHAHEVDLLRDVPDIDALS